MDGIKKPRACTKVSDAARIINFLHFGKLNMLFSKWAHPTALSIFSGDAGTPLNDIFLETTRPLAETVKADILAFLSRT
jgi:hypothetical protein